MKKETKTTVTITVEYNDKKEFSFDVTVSGNKCEILAELQMITRGTLMASIAKRATCYRKDGFTICSYIK